MSAQPSPHSFSEEVQRIRMDYHFVGMILNFNHHFCAYRMIIREFSLDLNYRNYCTQDYNETCLAFLIQSSERS